VQQLDVLDTLLGLELLLLRLLRLVSEGTSDPSSEALSSESVSSESSSMVVRLKRLASCSIVAWE